MLAPPDAWQLVLSVRIDGKNASESAGELRVLGGMSRKWCKRHMKGSIDGLRNRPGKGRGLALPPECPDIKRHGMAVEAN